MDEEKPILTGYLTVQSGFSLNRISKKKTPRYCLLFKSSRHGIERLEVCESIEDKNPKIITLENCVKITQESSPANLIQIVKKTGTLTINTITDADLKEWVTALQSVAFRDKSESIQTAIEEDNDLYCSSFGDGLFMVSLIPSEASKRCNMEAKTYMLHLTATELQLKSAEDVSIVIAKWPYRFIRKYGYRDGKFTFEAGRKCFTGEGVFTLDHTNPLDVFRCMSSKMKSMKKLINAESISNLDCGENQLSVAASMEAGSRSPLPPSPNQQCVDFETNSSQSVSSLRGLLPSSDCLTNSSNTNLHSSIKHIPNKPPRKLPFPGDKLSSTVPYPNHVHSSIELKSSSSGQFNNERYNKFQNYEPVTITSSSDPNKTIGSTVILKPHSPEAGRKANALPEVPIRYDSSTAKIERDYESIESITDAWKTLGVSEVKHTENHLRSSNSDKDLIDLEKRSFGQREKVPLNEGIPSIKNSKIVDIDIGEGGIFGNFNNAPETTYDHLNFLSANNKTSGGYKTILNVSTQGKHDSPPPNDYEYIASPDIQSCRKADDSYLGYGVLRKSTDTPKTVEQTGKNNTHNTRTLLIELPLVSTPTRSNVNNTDFDHRSYNGLNYTVVSKPKRV